MLFAPFLLALLFGFSNAEASPIIQTRLTDRGNQEVARRFVEFQETHEGCVASHAGPRVLLTGFGLFDGIKSNISGAVIQNLSDASFWPDDADGVDGTFEVLADFPLYDGVLRVSDHGGTVANRSFKIAGHAVNVCLLNLDVTWDLAGAIIAREMERFQPAFVLLTGVNGTNTGSIETGALNSATSYEGYYADGSRNPWASPQASFVLPDDEPGLALPLTWDGPRTGEAVRKYFEDMDTPLTVAAGPRLSNNYICNNVSYLAQRAAEGRRLELAGGLLVLEPQVTSNPKVGFFHFPLRPRSQALTARQAGRWARVLFAMIRTALF